MLEINPTVQIACAAKRKFTLDDEPNNLTYAGVEPAIS